MKNCCVVGLGYIGLPTAALLANAGHNVTGVDINQNIVDSVNKGLCHIEEKGLEKIISKSVKDNKLSAKEIPEESDVFIITVPTPIFEEEGKLPMPNLDILFKAIESITKVLKKNNLLLIESTSPIGTTEKVASIIQEKTGLSVLDIHIAYCPERVIPGNTLYEMINNDRVVGGITDIATKECKNFYQTFCKGEIITTDSRTAELVKLSENAYRDVNIAFANEMSMFCDSVGVDTQELIRIANYHPRVNILKPGCGVGGHCIAVDPWFIVSESPKLTPLIQTSRKVNNYKSYWALEKIKNKCHHLEKKFKRKPKIGTLGLSFKPDVSDLRTSPALLITKKLIQEDFEVLSCEPNLESHDGINLYELDYILEEADLIVVLVAHSSFSNLKIRNKEILDFVNTKISYD